MLKKHLTSTAQAAGLVLLLAGGVSSQTLVREYIHFNGRPIAIEEPMGNQTPTADSVTPAGGGGTTTTFSFTFSDANGVQDLNVLNVLINSGLDGVNACYLAFSNNILYLVPDSGTGLQVVAEDPDNSQCLISNVNVSNTATTRTLSMSIQFFQPAFSGGRVIYMAASDMAGANSGWRIRGSYQVDYPTPPSIWTPALSPNAGSTQSQAFTITHRFTGGANAITGAQLLINTGIDGANACYIGLNASGSGYDLVLVADNGSGTAGTVVFGSGTAQNSQCTLHGAGSSKVINGNDMTLTINLSFKPAFAGGKAIYTGVQAGSNNSGWQAMGSWQVP